MDTSQVVELPGLDCGLCGFRTCVEFKAELPSKPDLLKRCIHVSGDVIGMQPAAFQTPPAAARETNACGDCTSCATAESVSQSGAHWQDSLGRDFDFYLEHFPEDVGPREIILPHNPMITREMDIKVGDTLIGRPLGMSCGCPITHCGIVTSVEQRTGVITWCITGPLGPRQNAYKDLGYYAAEAYEGIITEWKQEPRIGMRYFFQPRRCMLQWRHSGLINFLNRVPSGWQVRLEGLFIG